MQCSPKLTNQLDTDVSQHYYEEDRSYLKTVPADAVTVMNAKKEKSHYSK